VSKKRDVCLSVRVDPAEAAALRVWCDARGIAINDALRRCVQSILVHGPADDAKRAAS
jgi:hypothetical protein